MNTNAPVKTKETLAKQLFIEADEFLAAGYGDVLDARKAALKSGEIAPTKTPLLTDRVFHFSHERRMERASKGIQDLHRTTPPARPRSFSPFLGAGSNRYMLLVVAVVAVLISVITAYTRRMGVYELGGNDLTFRAERFNQGVVLVITKTADEKALTADTAIYHGAVSVAAGPVPKRDTPPSAQTPVIAERIFFTLTPKETYRLFIPYDTPSLLVLLQTETGQLTVTVTPK